MLWQEPQRFNYPHWNLDSQSSNKSASNVVHIFIKETENTMQKHIKGITESEKKISNFD